MTRKLTDHNIEGIDSLLTINVLDEPGQGNACHEYQVSHFSFKTEDFQGLLPAATTITENVFSLIKFQNGPIKQVGLNGITNEVLLAILIDRLRGFQSGDFACDENALALTALESALNVLQARTRDRLVRQVEGTNNL